MPPKLATCTTPMPECPPRSFRCWYPPGAGIAQDADAFDENAFPRGRELAAVADAAGEAAAAFGNLDSGVAHRDGAGVGNAAAGAARADDGYVRDKNAMLSERRNLAVVRDASAERSRVFNHDAAAAGGNHTLAGNLNAAQNNAGAVDKNPLAVRADRAAVDDRPSTVSARNGECQSAR